MDAPGLSRMAALRSKLAGLILGKRAWSRILDFLVSGAYKQGWRDGYDKGRTDGGRR